MLRSSFRRIVSCALVSGILVAATLSVFAQASGGAEDKKAAEPPAADAEKLEPQQCGKVERLHALGDFLLASQPAKEDFALIKECGVRTVLNLREKSEMDWDEAEVVKGLGLEYANVPFKSPETLTDEVFAATRKLLSDKKKRPILVHCASANRVGAIWLAHRVLDDGKSYEDALKEAQTVGLKLPALEAKAKDYIERMRKQSAAEPKAKQR